MKNIIVLLLVFTGVISKADPMVLCSVSGLSDQTMDATLTKDDNFKLFRVGGPVGDSDSYLVVISFQDDEGKITAVYNSTAGKQQETTLGLNRGIVDLKGLVLGDKKISIFCVPTGSGSTK